ncbi:NUDIX hydrolase [Corynebacterium sp. ES2794-CONJ1]|uniref:NUDIX domain-containing protein n=1 Tax=unclassified Corynebacterium TaxID=2624378 RepID=UPI00216A0E4F|nr:MULTISPECIES: NUDIX hydrolase [unclassified Corynebacterium]MCS4489409.1 NUDIX hydrolase [Corynebacterium sp. ES2775-CONJ]MCS4491220.1 NUDIX hydrolase [Corynebacterium sp. ES2715-CONJ3]MCS4530899.1 NUDIX hydrolase [Corynebacterium sp. ES2730-CONJ]MCU9518264.1 NUDIX hydrolase [Corynebacterium sp. ES2794-CONJ1]
MTAHQFTVVGSELLVEAPIIAVRRDQVMMPGDTLAYREVVEHFGAVAVVALDNDRVLLIKQYRRAVDQRLWELPAGLLDIAGEDPLEGARRELAEEAGLSANRWGLLCDTVTSPGFCDEAVRIYQAEELSLVSQPVAHDEEADMSVLWVDLNEAIEMIMKGEIVNSIAIVGLMTAWRLRSTGQALRSETSEFSLRPVKLAQRRQAMGLTGDMKKKDAQGDH